MKPIEIINDTFRDYLYINYVVSTVCNYKCYYCFPGLNDGKYKFPKDITLLKKNLGFLINTYKEKLNKKKIRLNVAGGEPSIWPLLGEFAEYFYKEFDCKITLTTNGSRTLRFWKEYANYFEDICITVHHQEADINHVKEVMDWIFLNTDVLINAIVLMDNRDWDKCERIVNELKNHPTPWLLKVRPLLINDQLVEYTEEQLSFIDDKIKKMPPQDWISKMKSQEKINTEEDRNMRLVMESGEVIESNTQQVMKNNWYHFTGWKCNLGLDRLQINQMGDLDGSCGARNLFNLSGALSIHDENFIEKFKEINFEPIPCRMLACTCPSEVKIPKRKE